MLDMGGRGRHRTRSSSCLRACSTTPSWPLSTIHMRLRSRISVLQTTRESMLNPLPAKIPDTRDKTPGSFCTRQLRVCLDVKTYPSADEKPCMSHGTYFLYGCKLGGGVLYSIFVTASSAVLDLGMSMVGRGGGRAR
jgi:hypothetical protein